MSQTDDAKAPKKLTLQRAFRDAVIDARLSSDLDDEKARQLLDVLSGAKAGNIESERIYQRELKLCFALAGALLLISCTAWLILILQTTTAP
jgi:hypothetical protein